MAEVRARIAEDELFFDSAIVSHGFAEHMRDYDVVIDVPAARPGGGGSYIEGRYRYRFSHCPEVAAETRVGPETWRLSWGDHFVDYAAWEQAGKPPGFVWGVNWAAAYPGMSYVEGSEAAARWAERFGREMHEVEIESNVLTLRVVFHDFTSRRLERPEEETR